MLADVTGVGTETTPCPLCGETAHTPLMHTMDRLCHSPGQFQLVRCLACSLVYLNPRPTLGCIGKFYPVGYDPFLMARLEDLPTVQRLSVRYGLVKRCRLVTKFRRRGRLLDVGCGTGQFLAEMRRRPRWEVMGVEPSHPVADFAQNAYGLDVHVGDLRSARLPDAHFDVITMWDVLEHLHAPLDELAEVRRILKDDGYLILRTPSVDSLDARVFGPFWQGLDSPRHLAVYSRHTAAKILERAGFELTNLRTGTGSYFTYLLSYRLWINEAVGRPYLRRAFLALGGSWPVRLILSLPLTIADATGLGSQIIIAARPGLAQGHSAIEQG